jgi:transposase
MSRLWPRKKNRLQKVLEDANTKLGSVVSKIDGKSSMKMIRSLLEKDDLSREEISDMARGKLKSKVPQLVDALNGRVTPITGSLSDSIWTT